MNNSRFLAAFLLFLAVTASLSAQRHAAAGKDFWFGFPTNYDTKADPSRALQITVSGTRPCSVTIEVPLYFKGAIIRTFAITSAQPSITYDLATEDVAQNFSAVGNKVSNLAIHVKATDSVNVVATDTRDFSTDATFILPTPLLDSVYRVVTYTEVPPQLTLTTIDPEFLMIVPAEDSVSVEILFADGQTRDTVRDLRIGQLYYYSSKTLELTGALIRGTGAHRTFALFAGNEAAYVSEGKCTLSDLSPGSQSNNCCSDILWEQTLPLKTWGTSYAAPGLRNRLRNAFRIVADQDSTTIHVADDGGAFDTLLLNAGQYKDTLFQVVVNPADPPVYNFRSNKPIAVAQLSTGQACDKLKSTDPGIGDPFMMILAPLERLTLQQVTFKPFKASAASWQHNLVLVLAAEGIPRLSIAGGPHLLSGWKPLADTNFVSTLVSGLNSDSTYTLRCPGGFWANAYGFSTQFDSYGFFLGLPQDSLLVTAVSAEAYLPAPRLFPNPSSSGFTLDVMVLKTETALLTLTDAMGREVFRQNLTLTPGQNLVPIPAAGLSPGVYSLSLESPTFHWNRKAVKM